MLPCSTSILGEPVALEIPNEFALLKDVHMSESAHVLDLAEVPGWTRQV
jgi:hypothetical protein